MMEDAHDARPWQVPARPLPMDAFSARARAPLPSRAAADARTYVRYLQLRPIRCNEGGRTAGTGDLAIFLDARRRRFRRPRSRHPLGRPSYYHRGWIHLRVVAGRSSSAKSQRTVWRGGLRPATHAHTPPGARACTHRSLPSHLPNASVSKARRGLTALRLRARGTRPRLPWPMMSGFGAGRVTSTRAQAASPWPRMDGVLSEHNAPRSHLRAGSTRKLLWQRQRQRRSMGAELRPPSYWPAQRYAARLRGPGLPAAVAGGRVRGMAGATPAPGRVPAVRVSVYILSVPRRREGARGKHEAPAWRTGLWPAASRRHSRLVLILPTAYGHGFLSSCGTRVRVCQCSSRSGAGRAPRFASSTSESGLMIVARGGCSRRGGSDDEGAGARAGAEDPAGRHH
ncbi:hypothetical protein C8Q77DRAFT_796799 [Trametes polyzona]|nr:hypothetical protein C8Q77DRAFT_796799 [Trametes polyzona]